TRPSPHSRAHSQAMRAPASITSRSNHGRPSTTAITATGISTREETRRVRKLELLGARTVATVAAAEFADGMLEVVLREIRPQPVDEEQLGIGRLPEQEVADALLAAGADQQIRVRNAFGEQMAPDQVLVDVLHPELAGLHLGGDPARRPGNLCTAAIA